MELHLRTKYVIRTPNYSRYIKRRPLVFIVNRRRLVGLFPRDTKLGDLQYTDTLYTKRRQNVPKRTIKSISLLFIVEQS